MQFIPFEETVELINGQPFVLVQQTHQILRQRRLELGLTQAETAERAGILLRQYARIEGQEGAFHASGARIFLSVCAVLKLDPYMFFPEIESREKKHEENEEAVSEKTVPVEVIKIPAKPSRYISLQEYMDFMRQVPAGKVVTAKTVDAYFRKKYQVDVIVIESGGRFLEEQTMTFPFWRQLSANGQLYATTKFRSREQQRRLLEQDGLEVVPCGAHDAALKVKDYKNHLFDPDAG